MKIAVLGLLALALVGCSPQEEARNATDDKAVVEKEISAPKEAPIKKNSGTPEEEAYRTKMGAIVDETLKNLMASMGSATELLAKTNSLPKAERRKFLEDHSRENHKSAAKAIRDGVSKMKELEPPQKFAADHQIVIKTHEGYAKMQEDQVKTPLAEEPDYDFSPSDEALERMGVELKFDPWKAMK